jgi:hypothetical protein
VLLVSDYAALYDTLKVWFAPDGDLSTRAEALGLDPIAGIWDQEERIASFPGTALTFETWPVEEGALAGCALVRLRFLLHYRDLAPDESVAAQRALTMAQALIESVEALPDCSLVGEVSFLTDERDPLLRAVVAQLEARE